MIPDKVEINATNVEGNRLEVLFGETLPQREPVSVALSGTIRSLIDYAKKRPDQLNAQNSHVVIKTEKLSLTAVFKHNEANYFNTTVTGTLVADEEIKSLGINTEKTYTANQLRSILKLKRHLFKNREAKAAIINAIESFVAKTSIEFKSTNDYAGNVVYSKITNCTSNLLLEFELLAPVFVGYEKRNFMVKIEVQPSDGDLKLNLVSYDLVDIYIDTMERETKTLADTFAAIPIMYQ